MRFEDSKYYKKLKPKKLEFSFGNFYLCERFFVSEIHEGKHFGWKEVKLMVSRVLEHYEKGVKLVYVSNRVNSYSSEPQTWLKVDRQYDFIVASALITYNNFSYITASLEKHFSKRSIKRCSSIEEAINWINGLKEFN